MNFQVPQFIEHEAKVIGPLTFKQFVYLAVPGAIAFFFYFTAPFTVFVVAAVILEAIGLALAFLKTGGKSLPEMVINAFRFSAGPKTYIWKKEKARRKTSQPKTYAPQELQEGGIPTKVVLVRESKVKDLATKIETKK